VQHFRAPKAGRMKKVLTPAAMAKRYAAGKLTPKLA
jgi:hypothetical protein